MPQAAATERRRSPRRQVNQPIVLVVESEASQLTSGAFALDLSQLGARLRAKIRLEPGQTITVVPGGSSGIKIRCRVVWVNDEGEGCAAGIAFLEPVTPEEFASESA
jgi:hypothetical protein